ncbi:hypothetical protein PIB30_090397 [Stylosanthes scabra]|uniref:Uncharacterized protein n=1 Tax=Stylosanthes scabra TaxID=79078 RepID=A0ABU6TTS8_9FABA|nr:hypothetical protein [Stylosanthes scabra]
MAPFWLTKGSGFTLHPPYIEFCPRNSTSSSLGSLRFSGELAISPIAGSFSSLRSAHRLGRWLSKYRRFSFVIPYTVGNQQLLQCCPMLIVLSILSHIPRKRVALSDRFSNTCWSIRVDSYPFESTLASGLRQRIH